MTQPKQRFRTLSAFDARSVMLFAALAVAGAAVQAQGTSQSAHRAGPTIGPSSAVTQPSANRSSTPDAGVGAPISSAPAAAKPAGAKAGASQSLAEMQRKRNMHRGESTKKAPKK